MNEEWTTPFIPSSFLFPQPYLGLPADSSGSGCVLSMGSGICRQKSVGDGGGGRGKGQKQVNYLIKLAGQLARENKQLFSPESPKNFPPRNPSFRVKFTVRIQDPFTGQCSWLESCTGGNRLLARQDGRTAGVSKGPGV